MKRGLNKKQVTVLFLLGLTKAYSFNLGQPNSAFYLPSQSSPSALPSQCISWNVSTNAQCFCDGTVLTNPTMMINPSSILPSFYLKSFYGQWDSTGSWQSLLTITYEDLFDPSVQISGSAGTSQSLSLTHTFGPLELSDEIALLNLQGVIGDHYFKRWFFTGTNVIGSPYQFGTSGSSPANCFYYPNGPLIGVKSYLSGDGHYCGAAFAYNQCGCTSALYMLSDYSLKTMNWAFGDPPASLTWTITNSLTGMTNFVNTNCGNFLLGPVTTTVDGYTPVSPVTGGFIIGTAGNASSITLTNPSVYGTFNVLLQITNPSGYTITGDSTLYYVHPLYFYVKVVILCTPSFTLTTQTESPVNYTVYLVSSMFTTTTAILFTDSVGCGFVPTYSCQLSGVLCPAWIGIDASNKMNVNTNNPAYIGQYTVTIQGTYVSALGATIKLPPITWILNVNECTPAFTATTQPESPVNYTIYPASSMFTTVGVIQFTDPNGCGIVPTYSCKLSSGAACPSFITINASTQMTVNTNNPANIGQQTVNYSGTYVSQQFGVIVALPPTAWVLNVNECIPSFTLTTQPEGDAVNPFTFKINVDTALTTLAAILFTDSNSCGILPTYSCPLCPTYVVLNSLNKIVVNGPLPLNAGQYTIQIIGSYVSQWLGATVSLPNTLWYLNIIDPCATTSFNPVNFPEIKSLVGLQIVASYFEFQNAFGSVCGDQTQTISPLTSSETWTRSGGHATNDLKYTLGIDASVLTQGQTYTELISVFLNNYPQVKANFVQKITLYSATLSQIMDQNYTTNFPQLSIPFEVQWLPQVPLTTDPTYFLVTEGLIKTYNNQTPANQNLPSSQDFYVQVQPTNIDIYSSIAINAGEYKIQYSIQFKSYPTLECARTFNLKILQSKNPFASNVLPDFVLPNNWPAQVILGCSEAFVQVVPDCQDANNNICSEKIELGSAIMFAQYDPTSKKIYIEKDKLIPDFQGMYKLTVFISDGIGTTQKSFILTVACNSWHLQDKNKTSTDPWLVVVDKTPVIPSISSINNLGQVIISFSEPMKPVNYTKITNGTFKALDVTWPALAVEMKRYDFDKILIFTWNCTNYTSTSLILQLNFTHPNQVSCSSPRDQIQITFWGKPYYQSQTGNYVQFGHNLTKDMPTQIDQNLGKKFEDVGSAIGQTGKLLEIAALLFNLLLSGSLQQLLNQVKTLQIIVHQLLVNLSIPASTQILYGYLLQIVAFDVVPTDDFYDKYLELPAPVAMTESFQSLGYESKYFLRNAGSISLYFAVYPISLLVTVIFGKCRCKLAKKIHRWLKQMLVWNYWHGLVEDSYLILVVCTMIQLYQYSEDDLKFYGRLINFTCAVMCSPALFIHVFMVATLLCYNFDLIKKMHPDTDKFSKLFEDLQIRSNFTNRTEEYSGKHTIIYPIWSILRRLILGVTVTSMTEYPLWCLFIMNFSTLTSIIIVGTQEPFKDYTRRRMDLFNEFVVLVINYHLLCFTNFVADPVAREYLGYSMVVVTLLFIAINLGFFLIRIQRKPCARFKYCIIKTKNRCKRNQERKKAQELLSSQPATQSTFDVPKSSLVPIKTKKKISHKRSQNQITNQLSDNIFQQKNNIKTTDHRLPIPTLIKRKQIQNPVKTENFASFSAELNARMEKEFGKNSKQSKALAGRASRWFEQMLAKPQKQLTNQRRAGDDYDDDVQNRRERHVSLEKRRQELRYMMQPRSKTQQVARNPSNLIFGEGVLRPNFDGLSIPESQLTWGDLQSEGTKQRIQAQLNRERPWLRDFSP